VPRIAGFKRRGPLVLLLTDGRDALFTRIADMAVTRAGEDGGKCTFRRPRAVVKTKFERS
jgi:hypothetical protein